MSPLLLNAARDEQGRAIHDVEQGTPAWHELRRGLLTASVVADLITPGGQPVKPDGKVVDGIVNTLAAQRVAGFVEPSYANYDMMRGHADEITARNLYTQHIAPVTQTGIITRQINGIIIGASPDGLVGEDGVIEVKSRLAKYQVETVVSGVLPSEFAAQIQTILLVSGRQWCDFISICTGMPLFIFRVEANPDLQRTIIAACEAVEYRIRTRMDAYLANVGSIATERLPEATDDNITL
jgi:hypothetical protein